MAKFCRGYMTAADSVKLSSWMIAASRTFDKMMLIARIVVDESSTDRDNYLTSLVNLAGSSKHLS